MIPIPTPNYVVKRDGCGNVYFVGIDEASSFRSVYGGNLFSLRIQEVPIRMELPKKDDKI